MLSEEIAYTWLLETSLLILFAKLSEFLYSRIGLPKLLSYLTVGIAVAMMKFYYGYDLTGVTVGIASLGIMVLLFRAGLETNLRQFLRGFRNAGIVAVGGVLGSFAMSLLLIPVKEESLTTAFAVGVILSATSVSVTVATLEEMRRAGTKEAQAIVGAAVIDDVIGLALLSILQGLTNGGVIGLYTFTIPAVAFVVWFGTAWFFNNFADNIFKAVMKMKVEAGLETIAFSLLLLLAFFAQDIGLSTILIAYAFGMGVANYRYAAKRVEDRLQVLTSLFAPLFFVYAGSRIDFKEILMAGGIEFLGVFTLVTIFFYASKLIGCYIAARMMGFDHKSAIVVGVGMTPRAEVALVAATFALGAGLINQLYYVSTILAAIMTQFTVPVILSRIYRSSPA